jgi:hypothetical protein
MARRPDWEYFDRREGGRFIYREERVLGRAELYIGTRLLVIETKGVCVWDNRGYRQREIVRRFGWADPGVPGVVDWWYGWH